MPSRRPPRSLASRFLRSPRGQPAEILAVELQEVEGVQHGLGDGAAPVERVEDGDTIRTADHGLAVERERPGAQQQHRSYGESQDSGRSSHSRGG
jgi:hypothetical protein